MSVSIYDQTVTSFSHSLRALSALLEKARAHAETNDYDVANLLSARLFPDMFTLTRQIQLATDFAKGGAARLAGVEPPKWPDTESTLAELQGRIQKCVDFLATLKPAQFEGAEIRPIELTTPVGKLNFTGKEFLLHWAIPNFYFHCTTAYNLMRHNGVPVGKLEFLGKSV
jgi:uncharacterized protein